MLSSEAAWPTAEPLLSGMANSVQLSEAAATALPTPGAEAGTTVEGLDVVNSNHFTSESGSLYFVGEVRNSTDQTYQEVEVTVHLLDAAGTVLAEETWGAKTSLLQPNGTAPVVVIFSRPPAEWTDLRTEVSANPADFYLDYVYSDLELQQVVSDTTNFGDYRLHGSRYFIFFNRLIRKRITLGYVLIDDFYFRRPIRGQFRPISLDPLRILFRKHSASPPTNTLL